MNVFILRLRRFWATLHDDTLLALILTIRITQELEKSMALETTALEAAVAAVETKLQQDAATVASAQAALTAAQNEAAGDQAQIDALTARLNAAVNTPVA